MLPLLTLSTGCDADVTALAYSADGRRLIAGLRCRSTAVFEGDRRVASLAGQHDAEVEAVSCSADGRYVASVSHIPPDSRLGRELVLWDTDSDLALRVPPEDSPEGFRSPVYSPTGDLMAVNHDGLRWRKISTGGRSTHPGTDDYSSERLIFTPCGRGLLLGTNTGRIVRWDIATARPTGVLLGHTKGVDRLSLTPDGSRLGSLGLDDAFRVWDAGSGLCLACVDLPIEGLYDFAYVPSRSAWLVASESDGLDLFDDEGGLIGSAPIPADPSGRWATSAVVDPPAGRLAVGREGGRIDVYDLAALLDWTWV